MQNLISELLYLAKNHRHINFDFRIIRKRLLPQDFAVGSNKPNESPTDLIDADTWRDIVSLPDDVSIRTSDHFGSVFNVFWERWADWVAIVLALQDAVKEPKKSPIAHVACNAIDEFQASIYNVLTGFYRLAFSALRNIVEQMTIGLHLSLSNDINLFSNWLNGVDELKFGTVADNAQKHSVIINIEKALEDKINDSLFRQKNSKSQQDNGGFARRLFSELSSYTHGGPSFTNADIWQSNGPLFVPSAVEKWINVYSGFLLLLFY
jgi:hypothetical protein